MARFADAFGATQVRQVDDEGGTHNVATHGFDQLQAGERGAASGEQVVHQQDSLAFENGVGVNLDPVGAVFELVVGADGLKRQFPLLADRNEACVQVKRHRTCKDKPARLDTRHLVDTHVTERFDQALHGDAESHRVLQQRGDVAEHDPGLGVIGDGANAGSDRHD